MEELWKECPLCEKYEVSSLGRVRHYKIRRVRKLGFVNGSVKINTGHRILSVARMVASAFLNLHPNCVDLVVDHIDNNYKNNKVENLRVCKRDDTNKNRRGRKGTACSLKGVVKRGDRYESSIKKNGKYIYIGIYSTEQEAYLEYCKKNVELFGEYWNVQK